MHGPTRLWNTKPTWSINKPTSPARGMPLPPPKQRRARVGARAVDTFV